MVEDTIKALDDILFESVPANLHRKMQNVLDFTTWTAQNKDTKMSEVRQCARDLAEETTNFVKSLVTDMSNDKPIIYWKVLEAFMTAEYEFLLDLRRQFDFLSDVDLVRQPMTYEWINEQIRVRLYELNELNSRITSEISDPEVEEL